MVKRKKSVKENSMSPEQMWEMARGKKTYAVAALSVVWALIGLWMGWLEAEPAMQMIQAALLGGALRHGMK